MNKISAIFYYDFTTRIHDIDAAGVMFFGGFFYQIHNAYESMLNHHQFSIDNILKTRYLLPINHTEADFKTPIFLNEKIIIEIFLQEIKSNEFTLYYHLIDSDEIIRATAATQHICLDKNTGKRINLPEQMTLFLTQ